MKRGRPIDRCWRLVCLGATCAAVATIGCDRDPAGGNPDLREQTRAEVVQTPPLEPSNLDPRIGKTPVDAASSVTAAAPSSTSAMASSSAMAISDVESDPDRMVEPSAEPELDVVSTAEVDTHEDAVVVEVALEKPENAGKPIRMFVPTTSGPLVVDADIRIGNEPLTEVFRQRVESIMQEAASDSELTWDALFGYVAANPNLFGGRPVNEGQYRNMLRQYDRNRNKRPEYDEVVKFLFRDSRIAAPFRLTGSDFYRQINRMQSAIFMVLDQDESHALDEFEIERARGSLSALDHNGDRRIDFAEINTELRDDDRAWSPRRVSRRGDVAMDLMGYIDWQMLSYALDVAPRMGVFGEPQNVIARIDEDNNDSIEADEAKRLISTPADIALRVDFPARATGESPRIEITHLPPRIDSIVQRRQSANVISINSPTFRLIAVASDLRGGRNQIPPEAFAALDADRDGGLDESEIPAPALQDYSFEDLDRDEDGKLTLGEINEGMAPESPIWDTQIRARGAEAPDGIFAWLDENLDQMLSTRELERVDERLRDITGDGSLTPTDIPDSFVIHFGRGEPTRDEEIFSALPRIPSEYSQSWPRWAQSMDINRDGDISWEEFPGTRQQFAKLDLNQDGFIDGDEIR